MNLMEVTTASLLFLLATSGSLQVWAMATAAMAGEERRREALERMEGDLHGARRLWRQQAALGLLATDCGEAAGRLVALLESAPAASGVERRLEHPAQGELVRLEWRAEGLEGARTRLLSPAALGLCTPDEAPGGQEAD